MQYKHHIRTKCHSVSHAAIDWMKYVLAGLISQREKNRKKLTRVCLSLYFPYFFMTKKMHVLVNVCALCRFACCGALLRAMQLEPRLKIVPEAVDVFFKGNDKKEESETGICATEKKKKGRKRRKRARTGSR